jgi:2-polyprenyl-3-methyl-5-hydroxy-6-metoxy-1,4-benzoquinol methylase
MYNREEFDREYFEQGPMTGKSLYTNYRWLPELTLPMCHHIITYFGITADARILDFGCAKGYSVHGLRMLGYEANGVDVFEYAISEASKGSKGSIFFTYPFTSLGASDIAYSLTSTP